MGSEGKRRLWSDRVVSLGGGNLELLETCPQERPHFFRAGLIILSVACMASVSMGVALHMAFRLPVVVAALGGMAWGGLVICPLDAFLISALRRQRRPSLTAIMAAPRIALAIVIGLAVGIPLSLEMFDPEILAQVQTDQAAEMKSFQMDLAKQPVYAVIPHLQAQVTSLQNSLVSGGPPDVYADPTVAALQTRVNSLQSSLQQAETASGCEDGGTCGSGKAGQGPQWQADQLIVSQINGELTQAQSQLDQAEQAATTSAANNQQVRALTAQQELPALQHRLSHLQAQEQSDIRNERQRVKDSTGLAARLEALWNLSGQYPEVVGVHILMVLVLVGLECTPVVAKTLLLMGKESAYERMGRIRDDDAVITEQDELDDRRDVLREQRTIRSQVENEAYAATCREVLDAWREDQVNQARAHPEQFLVVHE